MAGSKNGVWIDKDTGKVVKTQPSRGRQIVAPGKESTPELDAMAERYQADVELALSEQASVETATTEKPAAAKKAAKSTKKAG